MHKNYEPYQCYYYFDKKVFVNKPKFAFKNTKN
jgi:hypothetical protein